MTGIAQAGGSPFIRRRHVLAWLLVVIVFHALVVTGGTFDFFGPPAFGGFIFNDMLLRLLDGRLDLSPAVLNDEAFVRDGRSYAYFGIMPALVRLPLLPFVDLQTVQVGRLSCFLAGVVAYPALAWAVMAAAGDRRLAWPFLVAVGLSGPGLYLGLRPLVFHEAILWAWAWAAVFLAAAAQALFRDHSRFRPAVLALMGAAAGACLHSRVSTGAGLYVAFSLVWGLEVLRQRRLSRGLLLAGLVAAAGVAVAMAVNQGRWGTPFSFGDLTLQVNLGGQDRIMGIARQGAFGLWRLGTGISYYLLPTWTITGVSPALEDMFSREYWSVDGPATSQVLLEPFLFALAGLGVKALWHRPDRIPVLALASGLAIPIALIMTFLFLAFRYRAEFFPLLLLLALVGLNSATASPAAPTWWRSLALLQVASCLIHTYLYNIFCYFNACRSLF